jgi:putative ABC transport system substrate-binding protein
LAFVNPSIKLQDLERDPLIGVFFDELKRQGFLEGENLIVERYSAEARTHAKAVGHVHVAERRTERRIVTKLTLEQTLTPAAMPVASAQELKQIERMTGHALR